MEYPCISIDKFASKNLINENKKKFLAFKELLESKSYVPIPSCLIESLLYSPHLSNLEKLLYFTIYSLGVINLNKTGHRNVALSALKLSKIVSCSKSQVLAIQKSLSRKDYLFVTRQKNKFGQNNRNLLSPILPNLVFSNLSIMPDKKEIYLPFNESEQTPLSYLERTKQYVPLNYQIFKMVASDLTLTPKQKILWLNCYFKAYKNSISNNKEPGNELSFTSSYAELAKDFSYSVEKISINLNVLVKEDYLQKQRFCVKNGSNIQDRCDKSLWNFTISLPAHCGDKVALIENRKGYVKKTMKPRNKHSKQECDKKDTAISDPEYLDFRPQLNKEFKIYKDRSRERADFQKFEKEEAEDKTTTETKIEIQTEKLKNKYYNLKRKPLAEIEPITEEEAIFIRRSSGRDFTCNYMNKLLQKLAKEYSEHGFYKRELFIEYMKITLSKELRETTKANNTDFNFSTNEQVKAHEKYLEEIETSYDTSLSSQLKKKVAGRFDSCIAYKILTSFEFQEMTYSEAQVELNQIFVISMIKQLNLAQHQQEMFLEQVKAVYGNKITRLEFKQAAPDAKDNKALTKVKSAYLDKPKDEQTLIQEALSQAIPSTIWHKVTKNLIIKYGIHVYRSWFAKDKMQINIDQQNKTLSLKGSTGFIASYVQSNYFSDIWNICKQENYQLLQLSS